MYLSCNTLAVVKQVQTLLLSVFIFDVNLFSFICFIQSKLDFCRLPKPKEALQRIRRYNKPREMCKNSVKRTSDRRTILIDLAARWPPLLPARFSFTDCGLSWLIPLYRPHPQWYDFPTFFHFFLNLQFLINLIFWQKRARSMKKWVSAQVNEKPLNENMNGQNITGWMGKNGWETVKENEHQRQYIKLSLIDWLKSFFQLNFKSNIVWFIFSFNIHII